MAEKDKTSSAQSKNIPKDGQVIMSMMKELGITDYDPKTVVQLTEFVYRYATSVLEEARLYANNSKKKFLDVDDVKLALQLHTEASFTSPPPREIILECANIKNYAPLPLIKPHCGLRLPPDKYCISACNYALKSCHQKKTKVNYHNPGGPAGMKLMAKPNVSYVKRPPMQKPTAVIPRPVTKISSPKATTTFKPKFQIQSHNMHPGQIMPPHDLNQMEIEHSFKRKRDEDDLLLNLQ